MVNPSTLRQRELVKKGLCGQCGKPRDGEFKSMCIECAKKNRKRCMSRVSSVLKPEQIPEIDD